jgi:hypothetical protein
MLEQPQIDRSTAIVEAVAAPRSTGHPCATWLSRRAAGAVGAMLMLAMMLVACGASSRATRSAEVETGSCKQIEAVLSDGPEPAADPIGYAQAQILPLRRIHTGDSQLAKAINGLASAFHRFSSSDGSRSAKIAVSEATSAIKTLCPGIEP